MQILRLPNGHLAALGGSRNVSDTGLGNILLSFPIIDISIEYGEFGVNIGPLIWNVPVVWTAS